jgi:hypothetical protein
MTKTRLTFGIGVAELWLFGTMVVAGSGCSDSSSAITSTDVPGSHKSADGRRQPGPSDSTESTPGYNQQNPSSMFERLTLD